MTHLVMTHKELSWPAARLGEALSALAHRAGLGTQPADLPNPVVSQNEELSTQELSIWVDWAAKRLGCEAQVAEMSFGDLARELPATYPALLRVHGDSFLLVLGSRGSKLRLLAPDSSIKSLSIREISASICEPLKQEYGGQWRQLLNEAEIPASKQEHVLNQLMKEPLAAKRFDGCWVLHAEYSSQTSRSLFRLLREACVLPHAVALLTAKIGQYLLWLASWGILGWLSFNGHMGKGWLTAWALLLVTLIPFQAAITWWQGLFAINLGGFLKRRLLAGALRLQPEEIRHWGVGTFLGQALEATSVETLAVSGGLAGVLGIVELAVSMLLLGKFALILALWCALAAFLAWRFQLRWERCTASRLDMTQDLIESMVGHRTTLAQQWRSIWHQGEEAALDQYLTLSQRVDRAGAWLMAAIPRGWLLLGLGCLLPSFIGRQESGAQTAVLLGGVLLAYTAFRKVTASFTDIAVALAAWKRIRPLFDAAGRREIAGAISSVGKAERNQKVMEADGVAFRYRTTGSPALKGCNLIVYKGERILLEGPSGGGKTTFASLLSGLRQPEAGLLLANGLDRHTLGDSGWHRCVAAAPQFHENHILTETLLFNCLMGRRWPPTSEDCKQAETVCRELGLGELLDRMPAGIRQMVGEGGWQLSHGEKSRIYIARALLQDAELVILDESFAALDPENLHLAMQCTLRRAETLMVIAHP
jgi:ATP-binding cassette, subfamily B, bacterial